MAQKKLIKGYLDVEGWRLEQVEAVINDVPGHHVFGLCRQIRPGEARLLVEFDEDEGPRLNHIIWSDKA